MTIHKIDDHLTVTIPTQTNDLSYSLDARTIAVNGKFNSRISHEGEKNTWISQT